MKATNVLTALLVVSVLVNVFLIGFVVLDQQTKISNLVEKTNALAAENMQLHQQLDRANISLQSYTSINGLTGFASIQAPAVTQRVVQQVNGGGFVTQNLVLNGTMMNLSVEIRPGEGRVLVQTTPLMGVVFQDAANTAVHVAQNRTGVNLSGSDVIFSIEAKNQIDSVDGPSAGALMTLATISALEKRPVNQNITLTGTIDEDGHVGAVGGVVEKAEAAKENGKTIFLVPKENEVLTRSSEKTTRYGAFQLIEEVPEKISAKDYIQKNVGINVTFVDSIDDILPVGLTVS